MKAKIGLCRCAGWSEPLLSAQVLKADFLWLCSYIFNFSGLVLLPGVFPDLLLAGVKLHSLAESVGNPFLCQKSGLDCALCKTCDCTLWHNSRLDFFCLILICLFVCLSCVYCHFQQSFSHIGMVSGCGRELYALF